LRIHHYKGEEHLTNAEIDKILSKIVHPDALGFYQSNAIYNVFRKFAEAVKEQLQENKVEDCIRY